MFPWGFAQSADAIFPRYAIKRFCKFLLKKKLGNLILGDIDLDQVEVQLGKGIIQLSDLALNVDYINQKLGTSPVIIKEGSIGSLSVRIPWKVKNCQIEVEELEIVLSPCDVAAHDESCSPSCDGEYPGCNGPARHESGMTQGSVGLGSVSTDIHEGVKTIAKLVKWFLTSFNVKIKNLIVALDLSLEMDEEILTSHPTLVLRIAETEYGTCVLEDPKAKLTNFIKFRGVVVEFLQMDEINDQQHSSSSENTLSQCRMKSSPFHGTTTPILNGPSGGFSGTLNLSIPWKNGSLDIHKVDADISIEPLEIKLRPRTIKWMICLWDSLKIASRDGRGNMHCKASDSVYLNAKSQFHSSTPPSSIFPSDAGTYINGKFSAGSYAPINQESATDVLLPRTHVIPNWVPLFVDKNQEDLTGFEPDFATSIDQFFECFDEMISSQSTLGNSGIWNWTCSVFNAITAASNLASGAGEMLSEQQHVETNLKAKVAAISVVLSFNDENQRHSLDELVRVEVFESVGVSDCPLSIIFTSSNERSRSSTSFSVEMPPSIIWVDFYMVNMLLDLMKTVELSVGESQLQKDSKYDVFDGKHDSSGQEDRKDGPSTYSKNASGEKLQGNIVLSNARIIFCFPPGEHMDFRCFTSWDKFACLELSRPLDRRKVSDSSAYPNVNQHKGYSCTSSSYIQLSLGDLDFFLITSADKGAIQSNSCMKDTNLFSSTKILSVSRGKNSQHSSISVLWQKGPVTGPWMARRAWDLGTSQDSGTRNNVTGKGHEFASVTTAENLEEANSHVRQEMLLSSAFLLHVRFSLVWIDLDVTEYQLLCHLVKLTMDGMSCMMNGMDATMDESLKKRTAASTELSASQTAFLVECDVLDLCIRLEMAAEIHSSLQRELPGSWCSLRLTVDKFVLLSVSNLGGIARASFMWVSHGEGELHGSITETKGGTSAVAQDFLLISCKNSSVKRGSGEGTNALSSGSAGTAIILQQNPQLSRSSTSITIRCGTIVAPGGRMDWFDAICSFFSSVACLLVAASLKISNQTMANLATNDYTVRLQDLGLLLCESSSFQDTFCRYSVENIRETGYVKVAGEELVEAVLRTKCEDGSQWQLDCSDSHISLHTCHDTTSALFRLISQLQNIFTPDVEDAIMHLQSRWNTVRQEHDDQNIINSVDNSDQSTISSASSEWSSGCVRERSAGLMDEILEDAFHETLLPQLIESYYISDLLPAPKSSSCNYTSHEDFKSKSSLVHADAEYRKGEWYEDIPFRIREDHILKENEQPGETQLHNICELPSINSASPSEPSTVKGRIFLKNIGVKWRMYAGSDWPKRNRNDANTLNTCRSIGRDTTVCLELSLSRMNLEYDMFPEGDIWLSKLSISVQDFYLYDHSRDAPWKMVLGYYHSKRHPRESHTKAFKLDLEAIRPDPVIPLEEYRLRLALLPMRLHLHQSQLDFLTNFFGEDLTINQSPTVPNKADESEMLTSNNCVLGGHTIAKEALLPFFQYLLQKFDIWPVVLRIDYIPHYIDLAALREGKYAELVNLVNWKGVELRLKHVHSVGVYGWSNVCETIAGEWLEDVSHSQIHKLLKGLAPIRSLFSVSSGAAKLVSLPLKSYKKDHRLIKGVQRGATAFLRSISVEAVGLGVHLAAGAHDILLQTENVLASFSPSLHSSGKRWEKADVRSNQPRDAQQGIHQVIFFSSQGLILMGINDNLESWFLFFWAIVTEFTATHLLVTC
ncbi:hypothetical protein QJS04_geneDACA012280 [Acorus gramineus]|uniref:Autophagy-related protein 2 n=1 Tax=Acorus gramineus TaxID=55184 RepID=A0AAV9A294_ACOGR|nr:hypothetical protein QJS04_geneDACA012280 [Acorus gramineus]